MQESQGVPLIGSELAVPTAHEMQSLGVTDALVVEYIPDPHAVQEMVLSVLE